MYSSELADLTQRFNDEVQIIMITCACYSGALGQAISGFIAAATFSRAQDGRRICHAVRELSDVSEQVEMEMKMLHCIFTSDLWPVRRHACVDQYKRASAFNRNASVTTLGLSTSGLAPHR